MTTQSLAAAVSSIPPGDNVTYMTYEVVDIAHDLARALGGDYHKYTYNPATQLVLSGYTP